MKISSTVMTLAGLVSADLDGSVIHRNGCVWPDDDVLAGINKMTYADDAYANFNGLSATGLDNPYAEGTTVCFEIKKNTHDSLDELFSNVFYNLYLKSDLLVTFWQNGF